jgi:hypothetical protein
MTHVEPRSTSTNGMPRTHVATRSGTRQEPPGHLIRLIAGPPLPEPRFFQRQLNRVIGCAIIASPLAPVLAAILSVLSLAVWMSDAGGGGTTILGAALGNLFIAWLVLALAAWALGLSTAQGALPATYGELVQWLAECDAWIDLLNNSDVRSLSTAAAYSQLCKQRFEVGRDLASDGARWFLGTGYANAWVRVHQAQEAMVRIIASDALPLAARVELLRLSGADLSDTAEGIQKLQTALGVLNGSQLGTRVLVLARVLDQLADERDRNDPLSSDTLNDVVGATVEVATIAAGAVSLYEARSLAALRQTVADLTGLRDDAKPVEAAALRQASATLRQQLVLLQPLETATSPIDEDQVRDVIQTIRMKIDNYRDKARFGLSRTGSDLTRTLTMTAMLAYALFWVVLEARVAGVAVSLPDQTARVLSAVPVLETAAGGLALFLWGALVSLFSQLWTQSTAAPDTGEDDFGLAISKLLVVPVLAGVAGLCGVVVGTFGGALVNQGLAGLSSAANADTLTNAFLPASSPVGLLYAAIFALSPNLLVARLNAAAALQGNLSKTSLGDGGPKK